MKASLSLRIASVLTFIHALLHTVGGMLGKPAPGPQQIAVAAMKVNRFLVLGNLRSFWDFYMGLGFGVSISLTIDALIFWQLGSMAKTDSGRLRPLYLLFAIEYAALAVNSNRYFFIGPVIAEILIAFCLGWAIFAPTSIEQSKWNRRPATERIQT
ncbi:hypothetical protein HNQ77_000095 [Silvibacterium bohemicum]|uniref:Uncharacterized protein n=1 Tax=Silvibacterium bohemicum TaxID=1577686 RepID=A0A841JNJ2_9BACT|nr:hypothetical protein [Silvibacterium bohemicum]MBB6142157.1 hypothetical protein [Silvibacterium bohemicum]